MSWNLRQPPKSSSGRIMRCQYVYKHNTVDGEHVKNSNRMCVEVVVYFTCNINTKQCMNVMFILLLFRR